MRNSGNWALAVVVFLFLVNAATATDLEITPIEDFISTGQVGGPFTPSSKDYQLTNVGPNSIWYGIDEAADWLMVEPDWGQLGAGQSVMVTVSLTSEADLLGEGFYAETLTFIDITNDEEQTREATLTISVPGGIWVIPSSFDVNVIESLSLTELLTIGNSGVEDLNFTIRTRNLGTSSQSMGQTAVTSFRAAEEENKIVLEYNFSEPVISRSSGYDLVQMEGLKLYERTGAPIVPVRPVTVLLAFGKKVIAVEVIGLDTYELPGTYKLPPAQKPYPLSYQGVVMATEPDPAIYGQAAPWPGIKHKELSAQSMRGYQLFTVNLFPLQYVPSTGKLTYTTKMRLEIDLADSSVPASVLRPSVGTTSKLRRIVDNPSMLGAYTTKGMSVERLNGTSSLPGGGPYEYVIITNETLEAAPGPWNFQSLRDSKIAGGMTATIVTTDWIYANYDGTRPDGSSDNQTRIRNFLIDAYQSWGTEYVLLGGTDDIVPARKFWVSSNTGEMDTTTMPVDMYYGCVDPAECTFDYDADGNYGEPSDGVGGGDVDLYAEIYVGRATVENAAELENFIEKTLAYNSTQNEYLPRISMLGEHLGFGGVAEYAKDAMEQIRLGGDYDGYFTYGFENHTQTSFFDFNTLGCLDSPGDCWPLYDKDYDWPKSDLIDLMNGGIHLFNHLGHANYTYDMKLNTSNLSSLTNTDYFFAYSQGCNPGGFDTTNCFAEVITSMEYGAFAVVMNARSGWGKHNSTDGPSQRFARQFWDAALSEDMLEMGRANQESKEDNLWDINGSCIRWCYYELNLFGDPQQRLRFEEACRWLTIDPEEGLVGAGDSVGINITFNATELIPGIYEAEILILSDDPCNSTMTIGVTMTVEADDLQMYPAEDFESSGTRGGPFEPGCMIYTLSNEGDESLYWTTSGTEDWLDVEPNEGLLGFGESIDVNVCITSYADQLDPNIYTQILVFENTTSGAIRKRSVSLTVNPPDCFTESFDGGDNKLDHLLVTFSPDGSVAYYEACRERIDEFPTDPAGGTAVALGDDDFVEVILSNDVNVLFYGVSYDRFYIGSNGYITFGDGDMEYEALLENHFSLPRISALFDDLTPADTQSISYEQFDDRVVVTFEEVPLYGDKEAKNSFQIEMFFIDGTICITWLDIDDREGIAGLSEGYGFPPTFIESNLRGYSPCRPYCDFDRDYDVDMNDLAVFVLHWLDEDCNVPYWCGKTDVDFSSMVEMGDYAICAESWLVSYDWWLEPIAHWRFDEGQGDTAYDSAGNNDGTLIGPPEWVDGQIGDYGLEFDGAADYVEMGDTVQNYLGTSYTVSAWIKADAIASNKVIAAYRQSSLSNASVLFQLDHYNADARFTVRDDFGNMAQAIYSNAITTGIWYHFAGVREENTLNVYVNGVSGASDSEIFGAINSDNLKVGAFQFSGNPPQSFFDGIIDDVRIYDRALSKDEILTLYCEGGGSNRALNPNPADSTIGVDPNTNLTWTSGCGVLTHDVYLGTDYNDVNDANTLSDEFKGNYDVNSYDPCGLDIETTYYWRIDEENALGTAKGDVWSFSTIDINSGLAGWWELEEGTDITAYDSSGNGNDGVLIGPPDWAAGRIGDYALDFDGAGDYVEMGDTVQNYLETSYTVSAWIKADAIVPNKVIAAYRQSSLINPSVLFQLDHYNADARFTVRDDSGNIAEAIYSNAITAGIWHHVAGVREGNTLNVYVNGVSGASDSQTFGTISPDNLKVGAFQFSGNPPQSFFDGTIDDVRIYDRALSAGEIWALYQDGL